MFALHRTASSAFLLPLTLVVLSGGCGSEPAATPAPDASAPGKMVPTESGKMGEGKMAPEPGKMGDDKMAPEPGKMGDDKMAPKH